MVFKRRRQLQQAFDNRQERDIVIRFDRALRVLEKLLSSNVGHKPFSWVIVGTEFDYAVSTTSTLQCACSIKAGDFDPLHQRAAQPS